MKIISKNLYSFLAKIKILVAIKKQVDILEWQLFIIKKRVRLWRRKNLALSYAPIRLRMGVVCTNRSEYISLTINSINSLHYLNHQIPITVFTDSILFSKLHKSKKHFDYPNQVKILNVFGKNELPWQLCKLISILLASKLGISIFDADSRWFSLPKFNKKNPCFLVPAYQFKSSSQELKAIGKLNADVSNFNHYVTGFVYLPSHIVTVKYVKRITQLCLKLLTKQPEIRRLAEEIALSVTTQEAFDPLKVKTLKQEDGPGNKQIMQSLYYGCRNKIY